MFVCLFLDPPPKVMAFLGNYVELKILRNQVSPINYEFEHQPNFEVHWVGTPKGKSNSQFRPLDLLLKTMVEIALT